MTKKSDEVKAKITELEEDLKRAQADMFNIRRRAEEDRIKIGTFAKTEVIKELLPVIDNLDRAIAATPADLEKTDYVKGLLAVQKQVQSTLVNLGVERIKTVGEVFNPHTMEAVASEGEGSKEMVSDELQAGYTLAGQSIRPATVKIKKL